MKPRILPRLPIFFLVLPMLAASKPLSQGQPSLASSLEERFTLADASKVTESVIEGQLKEHEMRSPEELILTLGSLIKPDWASKFRPPVSASLKSRVQTALLAGSLFADGYLAAQAEDSQQCRNVARDLIALAKNLGVQAELLDRSRSLADAAQRRDWAALRRELESTQGDLSKVLKEHNDDGLARLVALGAWVRSVEIVASILSDNYSENTAAVLRLPSVGRLLDGPEEQFGEKVRSDTFLISVRGRLGQVARLLDGAPSGPMSKEDVGAISSALSSVLQDITSRQN